MGELIRLQGKRIFTLPEAEALLPVVKKWTAAAVQKAEAVGRQMSLFPADSEKRQELEELYNAIVEAWVSKMHRLGCEAKGLWLVDFDSGTGYYCWQQGEQKIGFCHGYDEGFSGRRPLNTFSFPTTTLTLH